MAAKRLRIKPTTYAAYTAALAPVIQRYGRLPVQAITRADVETLIAELVAGSAGAGGNSAGVGGQRGVVSGRLDR